MQHAQIAACKPQWLFLQERLLQFFSPDNFVLFHSKVDGMVAAETAINVTAAIQSQPVAIPAEWLRFIGDDPE